MRTCVESCTGHQHWAVTELLLDHCFLVSMGECEPTLGRPEQPMGPNASCQGAYAGEDGGWCMPSASWRMGGVDIVMFKLKGCSSTMIDERAVRIFGVQLLSYLPSTLFTRRIPGERVPKSTDTGRRDLGLTQILLGRSGRVVDMLYV